MDPLIETWLCRIPTSLVYCGSRPHPPGRGASFWYFGAVCMGPNPMRRGTFPARTIELSATADMPRVARSEFS